MTYRFCVAAALTVACAASAQAQGQQKLQLSLDPNQPATTAPAPRCSSVDGRYSLVDDGNEPFGVVSGGQTKGTWLLSATVDGETLEFRSNWACEDDFTAVYTVVGDAQNGPQTIYVIEYDDGSVGIEAADGGGGREFVGFLVR